MNSTFENRRVGERGRNRTFNLLIKSQLLCQLSYAPIEDLRDCWRSEQEEPRNDVNTLALDESGHKPATQRITIASDVCNMQRTLIPSAGQAERSILGHRS